MSAIRDLFADFDAAPAPAPVPPLRQPIAPAGQPEPAIRQPATPVPPIAPAWRYVAPPQTPAGVIAFRCMCGALDERPEPSLDNITCWKCGEAGGMRPRPWHPTNEERARFARGARPAC